jgi:rRNA processing protein Krr1/Pno1
VNGISGAVGLLPTVAALNAGSVLALANKESLVIGGAAVTKLVKPGQIVPVDSEHSAIAQCLRSGQASEVKRLVLTASGGPFRSMKREQLENVTPQQALNHPTWSMGPVVTINSATMMNKGLEVIEAHLLFNIDFENIENNVFTAISQFKVKVTGTDHHIIPDLVLFVNGLPIVVVEAKSSKVKEPIAEAIDQLMRYSEQRGDTGEGNKELFFYNQFIITTCRTEAKFGTITTGIEKHFYRWTDPYPKSLNDLEHGASSPNDQQRMVAGMLDLRNLLDIIQVFTVFQIDDKGKKIKVVGRYQQFRAVKIATKRLIEGNNPLERGGIIWHTQGSGKSLTMMFMVREMRLKPALQSWKIVFITDRTQLEEQLSETGHSIGFTIKNANFINPKATPDGKSLKELLSNDNSDMVMAMIHKFQENGDLEGLQIFPELNPNTDEQLRMELNQSFDVILKKRDE